jgi:S-formylglutathione hydrolase
MSDASFETVSKHRCFGGTVGFYKHQSAVNNCTMKFAVYTPPQAERGKVPALYYLAGLTCTEETFQIKAGAQRRAAELGLMLISMDTSPRGVPLPGDSESYDFGVGAGFYLDATQDPWSKHYRLYSYVTS